MKTIFTLALAAATFTGCAGTQQPSAQTEANETTAVLSDSLKRAPLCGGYTEQREATAEELTLFKRVTAELDGVGYTPESVATQIVAGTNYRFICKATPSTREPQSYKAEVIIYQPLPKQGDARITAINKL